MRANILFLLPVAAALPSSFRQRSSYGYGYPNSTRHIPTIYIAGDSTTAPDGGHNGTQGWGEYLKYSLGDNAIVDNLAVAGTSARSYTREGGFANISALLEPGDWVIIEFGHNDGSSPYASTGDNGRADCPGQGNETCPTVYNNVTEIVLTYPAYIMNAASTFLSQGARVIVSSPTPDNPWETGNYTYSPNRFSYYAWLSVAELGGPAAGIWYVDHGDYAAQAMKLLGPTIVDENYPMDHTHTAPYLADIVCQSWVLGLKCGTAPLSDLVVNATARIEGDILGTCYPVNATLPV